MTTMRCHDMEGVARFSDRAAAYARARPSYPAAAIEAVLAAREVDGAVADVGAGTGISTRLLAAAHGRAIGLDPNLSMLATGPRIDAAPLAAGRAEEMPLRSGSAALLAACNAFHWFKPERFFLEAHRVIATDGTLALLWNDWDHSDAFTSAFVRLMRSCADDFPPEDREAEVAPLYETLLFRDVRRLEFENVHVLDRETLPLRLQSMSYVPREGPEWERLSDALGELYREHAASDGTVSHRYVTALFLARRA
jgi:SAM-dependent methyltransferase